MADGDGIKRRGFASMTPERRRELASKGGQNVPREKRIWAQQPNKASEAGSWERPNPRKKKDPQ